MTGVERDIARIHIKLALKSELAATINQADATAEPIRAGTGDTIHSAFVTSQTHVPRSADDIARSRAAIRTAIGSWKGIDPDHFNVYIAGRRRCRKPTICSVVSRHLVDTSWIADALHGREGAANTLVDLDD